MHDAKNAPLVLAAAIVALAAADLSAHRRDELLQAARLAIEPGRVELFLDLTPGIDVAEAIINDLDRDRDGTLARGEQQAYVDRVLGLVWLHADGRPLRAEPVSSTFPALDSVRRGEGTIRLRAAAVLPRLGGSAHQLTFHNRHRPEVSVYLANALVPDGDSVAITAQRRDPAQRDLAIDYVVRGQHGSTLWLLGIAGAALMAAVRVRAVRNTRMPRRRSQISPR